jgi:uncharacterized protein (DUF885 family)
MSVLVARVGGLLSIISLSVALGVVTSAGRVVEAQPRATATIDDFFRDFTTDWIRHDPELARRTRLLSGPVEDELERHLTPRTRAWREERIDRAQRGLASLAKFDKEALTASQRLSADMLRWELETIVNERPFFDYSFPLAQVAPSGVAIGSNVSLVDTLVVSHSVHTLRDAENYVAALGEVGMRLREARDVAKRNAAAGISPPGFILDATITQMRRFTTTPAAQNPFVESFDQKMTAANVNVADRAKLRSEAERIVASDVYPAWNEAITLLESQRGRATADAGLSRLPKGAEAYRYFLRLYTTTGMTPEQVHEVGLRQVEIIDAQMDEVLRRLGFTDGSIKERIERLRGQRAYPNPTSEESRAAIMRDIDAILRDAQERSKSLFLRTPRSPVRAEPYPDFQEANAAAGYIQPTADGSRPGVFRYPRRVERMTKFDLKTSVYHETVPGHHLQIALQLENSELPAFRQQSVFMNLSAFAEGWGLYAEKLAADSGWYKDELESLVGQLYWEEFRARRLVVDTGLHAMGWTREQAIDYGIEPAEVERYVVYPGQACSYMIGELKLLGLRENVRLALGERFSLPRFHDFVLSTGMLPLELLDRETDAFIVREKGD